MAGRIPARVGPRVLIGVILTGTLSVLDSTLVVPLLTTIGADFGVRTAFGALAIAALLALFPAFLLPSHGRERQLLAARDAKGA